MQASWIEDMMSFESNLWTKEHLQYHKDGVSWSLISDPLCLTWKFV